MEHNTHTNHYDTNYTSPLYRVSEGDDEPITTLLRNPLLKDSYLKHRRNANYRGIGFDLSFQQWTYIWLVSGHMDKRGTTADGYVMGRHCDSGPYAWGNVAIIPHVQNARDGQLGFKKTAAHAKKLRQNLDKIRPVRAVMIDGIHYESMSAVARKLNITPQTVANRCNSERPKWKDWVTQGKHKTIDTHEEMIALKRDFDIANSEAERITMEMMNEHFGVEVN